MSTGPKGKLPPARKGVDGRGGARPGAGRKKGSAGNGAKSKTSVTDSEKQGLIDAARRKAEETGKTIGDILMGIAYSNDKRAALPAVKAYFEHVIPKEVSSKVEKTVRKTPVIELPRRMEDPAEKLKLMSNE